MSRLGFIVTDRNGTLFGYSTGEVVTSFTVELPKKFHGRTGHSALRFSRLRDEKQRNYIRKIAETAIQVFVSDGKLNCAGIVLAGFDDIKNILNDSDLFDRRLKEKIVNIVNVQDGFNQALEKLKIKLEK